MIYRPLSRIALVVTLLVMSAPVAQAQRADIPNGGFGGSISREGVDFHYQYILYPDNYSSTRDFRTLILDHGQPYWNIFDPSSRDPGDDTIAVNHLRDSLRAAGWRWAAGAVSGRWLPIAYDSSWQHLWLPMGVFDIRPDSTLVVMIDRADHIGGPPRIASVTRIGKSHINAWLNGGGGMSMGPGVGTDLLDSAAASSPVVKEFIDAMRWTTCAPQNKVFLDFEVDQPAQFIPDKSAGLVPLAIHKQPGITDLPIQFIVDTAGRVELSTLLSTAPISDALRAAAQTWRFHPGVAGRCTVRMLEQMLVVHR